MCTRINSSIISVWTVMLKRHLGCTENGHYCSWLVQGWHVLGNWPTVFCEKPLEWLIFIQKIVISPCSFPVLRDTYMTGSLLPNSLFSTWKGSDISDYGCNSASTQKKSDVNRFMQTADDGLTRVGSRIQHSSAEQREGWLSDHGGTCH